MGREIKRVVLDFDGKWGEVWEGYLNPHGRPCPKAPDECVNGRTTAGAWLESICQFITLVGEQAAVMDRRTQSYPHPYLQEFALAPTAKGEITRAPDGRLGWVRRPKVLPPSPEFLTLVEKLSETELDGPFGFGGSARWRLAQRLLELAGQDPDSWGVCPVCKGSAMHPDAQDDYDAWEPTPPPAGPGWQVWETVSEGSPCSPVFATAEALIDWLCEPKGSDKDWSTHGVYGDGSPKCYSEQGQTREAAEAFVKGCGWVPSAIGVAGRGLVSGIAAAPLLGGKHD